MEFPPKSVAKLNPNSRFLDDLKEETEIYCQCLYLRRYYIAKIAKIEVQDGKNAKFWVTFQKDSSQQVFTRKEAEASFLPCTKELDDFRKRYTVELISAKKRLGNQRKEYDDGTFTIEVSSAEYEKFLRKRYGKCSDNVLTRMHNIIVEKDANWPVIDLSEFDDVESIPEVAAASVPAKSIPIMSPPVEDSIFNMLFKNF